MTKTGLICSTALLALATHGAMAASGTSVPGFSSFQVMSAGTAPSAAPAWRAPSRATTSSAGAVWVGAGETYSTVSAGLAAVQNGGTVYVKSGTYTNDFSSVYKDVTIVGVGNTMPKIVSTVSPPNGKAALTMGNHATVANLEISGNKVPDNNGAAIRFEGATLDVDHVYIHDNQDGIITSEPSTGVGTGSITIANSEFANNGAGDGASHGIYIGHFGQLKVTNSYFHDANGGHQLKSRAWNNDIENSIFADGPIGNGSYTLDLPNGGNALIANNILQKGPNQQNIQFIAFAEEGASNPNTAIAIDNNLFVNDTGTNTYGLWNNSAATATLDRNAVWLLQYGTRGGPATITDTQILNSRPTIAWPTDHEADLTLGSFGPSKSQ